MRGWFGNYGGGLRDVPSTVPGNCRCTHSVLTTSRTTVFAAGAALVQLLSAEGVFLCISSFTPNYNPLRRVLLSHVADEETP